QPPHRRISALGSDHIQTPPGRKMWNTFRHPILQGAEKCSTSSCPAEFECDLIRERRYAGVEAAWARGRTGSRPPLLSGDKLRTARENPRADQLLPLNPRGGV